MGAEGSQRDGDRAEQPCGDQTIHPLRAGIGAALLLREDETLLANRDDDRLFLVVVVAQDGFGERVFEETFDRAAERTGAVFLVPAVVDQVAAGGFVDHELHAQVEEALGDLVDFDVDDLGHVRLRAAGR